MNANWIFFIESSILLGILYACYKLFMYQATWFSFNRWYLLLSIPLALILAGLHFPDLPAINSPLIFSVEEVQIEMQLRELIAQSPSYRFEPYAYLWFIYLAGVLFTLTQTVFYLFILFGMIRNSDKQYFDSYVLVESKGKVQLASFGPYIFWDENRFETQADRDQALLHEINHVKQGHTYDLIYFECIKILFWFHPLVYLLKRELSMLHEYLADRATIEQGFSRKNYIYLMLQTCLGTKIPLTHTFFESPALSRLRMLQKGNLDRYAKEKYIWLMPLLASLLIFTCCNISVKVNVENDPKKADNELVESTIGTAEVIQENPLELLEAPGINEFIVVEQEPKPLNMVDVQRLIGYPHEARKLGIQGNVVVRVLLNKEGRYLSHKVLNGVSPLLSDEVEKYIPEIRFSPAIQAGKPISFWVNIPFVFKLLD